MTSSPLSLETGLDAVELETFRLLLLSFLRALLEVDLGRDLRGDISTPSALFASPVGTAGLSRRPHSVPQRAIAGSKATLSGATPGTGLDTRILCSAGSVVPFTRISDANLCVTGSGIPTMLFAVRGRTHFRLPLPRLIISLSRIRASRSSRSARMEACRTACATVGRAHLGCTCCWLPAEVTPAGGDAAAPAEARGEAVPSGRGSLPTLMVRRRPLTLSV